MTRKQVWGAPLALAAAVIAVIVTVMLIAGSGGDRRPTSSPPALLHLAADTGTALGAAEPANRNGGVEPGQPPYVLDGTLPGGHPADRPVWRVGGADRDAASRVARALGLDGAPARIDGGWVLRSAGDNRLLVRDNGGWSYGMDCLADQPLSQEKPDVMCASAVGGVAVGAPRQDPPEPVDPPQPVPTVTPGPSAAGARADAAPILDALGLAAARVTASEGTPTTTVQASYDVSGIATVGYVTTLSFDSKARLVSADGWLPDAAQGDSYPVVTAQRAFRLLQEQPRPMIEMCMRRPDGRPGCADIPPTVITGARLGLSMAQDNGRPTLVPAWLFTVKGQDEPLAQVAVEARYLAPPATAFDGTPGSVPPGGETKPVVTPVGGSPA